VRTGAEGFTLLEMLISISLIAMLMLTLLVGLRVGSRAWQQGEARLRQVHIEEERNAFLMDQVSTLVPYVVTVSDPDWSGTFTVLEARATCLRFVTGYGSAFRSRSGLLLAEYGIVASSRGVVDLALRETPIRDDSTLFRMLVQRVARDSDAGDTVITYQPFSPRTTDLRLMTGLRTARFEYLDLHPPQGQGAVWLPDWKSRPDAPYPDAIRLRWERRNQAGEQFMPIRARFLPQSQFGP
jgi:prepilin-type N-terminal cleavage/methylation domain-containing protein